MKKAISIILCVVLLGGLCAIPISAETRNPFTDVPEDQFYFEPVLWAVANGITNGTAPDKFGPNAPCNRAQVVTFLWRAAGKPEPAQTGHPFTDISTDGFYYKAVLWAVEEGITNGTAPDKFGPNDPCNRAQVVTFLWRAAGKPEPLKTEHPFTDVQTGDFYYKAMLWAAEEGITNGISATSFGPTVTCNRGQIVTFIYRHMTSDEPLEIVFQPDDYYMESSQESATFSVTIRGGSAPYTYQWVTLYDNEEVKSDPVTAVNSIHVFTKEFSDYDFDNYRSIGVYCIITDSKGLSVTSGMAEVYPRAATPLSIISQPQDYRMESSQEDAEFTVAIQGGIAPYTYEWVVCYDSREVWHQPEVTADTSSTFRVEISDYDFDEYRDIGVYCLITDSAGNSVKTQLAEVFSYSPMRIVTQPANHQMTSSQEDAVFSVSIAGGVAPYSYEWVVCYDNREVWYEPEVTADMSSTFRVEISDYDFDEYRGIGVYCVITDGTGHSVESEFANILQH